MAVARQSVHTLAASLLYVVLTLATSILVARLLGPVGKGQVVVAVAVATLLAAAAGLGLPAAIVYHVGRKDGSAEDVFAVVSSLSLLLGGVIAAGLWVSGPAVLDVLLRGLDTRARLLSMALIPLMLWAHSLASVLVGSSRIREYNRSLLVEPLAALPLTVLLVSVLGWGAFGAVLSLTLALGARIVVTSTHIRSALGIRLSFRWSYATSLVAYGVRAYPASLVTVLSMRLDLYLLNALSGNAAVGLYSLGVGFVEMTQQIPEALRTVIHGRLVASRDYADQATPRACRQVVLVEAPAFILAAVLWAPVISWLCGKAFVASTVPFLLLLPAALALSLTRLLFADLQARGRPGLTACAAVLGLAFMVMLDLLLIPRLGASGAAIASSLSHSGITLGCLMAFARMSGVPPVSLLRVGRDDVRMLADTVATLWRRARSRAA